MCVCEREIERERERERDIGEVECRVSLIQTQHLEVPLGVVWTRNGRVEKV